MGQKDLHWRMGRQIHVCYVKLSISEISMLGLGASTFESRLDHHHPISMDEALRMIATAVSVADNIIPNVSIETLTGPKL